LSAECKESAVPLWLHTRIAGLGSDRIHPRIANALQMNGDHRAWAGNTIVIRDDDELW